MGVTTVSSSVTVIDRIEQQQHQHSYYTTHVANNGFVNMSVNGFSTHLGGDEPTSTGSHGQLQKTPVPAQLGAEGQTCGNDVRKRSYAGGENFGRFRVMTEKGVENQRTMHI